MAGNYVSEEGVVINSDFERFSYRINLDGEITSFLRAGLNLGLINENSTNVQSSYDELYHAINWSPTEPIYNEDGSYNELDDVGALQSIFVANPVMRLLESQNENESSNTIVNAFVEVDILPSLTFKTIIGTNNSRNNFRQFRNEFVSDVNSAQQSNFTGSFWQFSNYLTYSPEINQSNKLTLMAGFERSRNESNFFEASASDFTTGSVRFNNLSLGLSPAVDSEQSTRQLESYFTRLNYQYDDRYLLTATIRADGSSVFGDSNPYAYFPSVGIGWNVSNERFFPKTKAFNSMKIRGSFGYTGNQAIDPLNTLARLEEISFRYGTGTNFPGFTVDGAANPNLKWETTRTIDFGLDLGLLNNRLLLTIDYFNKQTDDLLLAVPLPDYNGGGAIVDNVGGMNNRGFELSVTTTPISNKDFSWVSSLNLTYALNEITSLGNNDTLLLTTSFPFYPEDFHILVEGEPMGAYYGYQFEGIYQTSEADQAAIYGKAPGDSKYADLNGDDAITGDDREITGYSIAPWRVGFNNTVEYKSFRLNVFLEGVFGFQVLDAVRIAGTSPKNRGGGRTITLAEGRDFWTEDNQNAEFSNPTSPTDQSFANSSQWLVNGGFVRLNNVTLTYKLPERLFSKSSVPISLEVYASAQNVAILSDFEGGDPESSRLIDESGGDVERSDVASGFNFGTYPRTASYTFGLRLGLN